MRWLGLFRRNDLEPGIVERPLDLDRAAHDRFRLAHHAAERDRLPRVEARLALAPECARNFK